ncbi:MAG: DUF3368 domain-containing protein [Cyanobacteria bacterium K_DeepCast_35m_m2_023]|nr:DUF3368 domain-containing protein [Cyanobacteria bacterium K_DeepCast_35m_m2_023]
MAEVVVADAGPLIALARVERLHLLEELSQQVLITQAVAAELQLEERAQRVDGQHLQSAVAAGWLRTHNGTVPQLQPLNPGVDSGEASAISLAVHLQTMGSSVLLLIDDRAGRAEAQHQGLSLVGTAAVAILAAEDGLTPSPLDRLNTMRSTGYYLSDAVLDSVARHTARSSTP